MLILVIEQVSVLLGAIQIRSLLPT